MMKMKLVLLTLALGISASLLTAQDAPARPDGQRPPPPREGGPGRQDREHRGPGGPEEDRRGPGGHDGPGGPEGDRRGPRPPMPLLVALDLNHDGVIDAEEIAKASESLKKLDKNGDGKLTPDEIHPPRPGGRGGPGGPGPDGRPEGPGPRHDDRPRHEGGPRGDDAPRGEGRPPRPAPEN